MTVTIDTTTAGGDATAAGSNPLMAVAPSDATINLEYFGTNGSMLATLAAPYSSAATQGIGSASNRNSQGLVTRANDNLDIMVGSPASGPFYFQGVRSGGSWTLNVIGPIDGGGFEAALGGLAVNTWFGADPQGRIWSLGIDNVLATYQMWCDYWNGSAWTAGSNEGQNIGETNRNGLAAAIIGNYLVVVIDAGSGALQYQRLDVSGASVGSFSALSSIAGVSGISTSSVLALRSIPGGSTGMLIYNSSSGIQAIGYDASSDTWGAIATLSSSTSDRHPALVPGASGSGDVYALWSQFAAASSYALVGEVYHAGAWAGSPTTLEASGTNLAWPQGAYLTSGSKLALAWTAGSSSPWSILFDTQAAPPPPAPPASGRTMLRFPHKPIADFYPGNP